MLRCCHLVSPTFSLLLAVVMDLRCTFPITSIHARAVLTSCWACRNARTISTSSDTFLEHSLASHLLSHLARTPQAEHALLKPSLLITSASKVSAVPENVTQRVEETPGAPGDVPHPPPSWSLSLSRGSSCSPPSCVNLWGIQLSAAFGGAPWQLVDSIRGC